MTKRQLCGVLGALFLVACDGSPVAPQPTPGSGQPPPPPPPILVRLEMQGPRTVPPGAQVQFRLVAHWSDGTSQDVTDAANFVSFQSQVVAVGANGIATALAMGDAFISAQYSGRRSTTELIVVPEGTFRVMGRVVEAGTPDSPVGAVRVEASRLPVVLSNGSGEYRLYGVGATERIRFRKDGYVTAELNLTISDHSVHNVTLDLVAPRADLSGTHQLTIIAGPECRGTLPEALLTRRFTAELKQNGKYLEGVAGGALFVQNRNRLYAIVEPSGVSLQFLDDTYYGGRWYFVEKVDDETALAFVGFAQLPPTGRGYAGSWSGSIQLLNASLTTTLAECRSSNHQVTLNR